MTLPLLHIDTTTTLPEEADVVIIGGGVAGVFSAYYLAKRGIRVAVLEKGRIGAEQSGRNWGWCRQQNRDARELELATKSLALWERLAPEIGEETGFVRSGLLYLSDDEAEIERWTRWRDMAREMGVHTSILNSAQATERGRLTGRRWKGGVFSGTDGIANPGLAAPNVARGIMNAGGTVHQFCAARGVEYTAGKVSAVVTEKGVIRTGTVVLAGGAWSSSFCRQLGVRLPQASVRSSVLALKSGVPGLPDALYTSGIAITRRGSAYSLAVSGRGNIDLTPQQVYFGREFVPMFIKRRKSLAVGDLQGLRSGHESLSRWSLDKPTPMERNRILNPTPDRASLRSALRRARALVPELASVEIQTAWAGYIDVTPDSIPAIGAVESTPGLVLATGLSGHGFALGPGVGHLVADLVTGDDPIVDPTPYNPARLERSVWGKVADL